MIRSNAYRITRPEAEARLEKVRWTAAVIAMEKVLSQLCIGV